jgi:hypothetical protein
MRKEFGELDACQSPELLVQEALEPVFENG